MDLNTPTAPRPGHSAEAARHMAFPVAELFLLMPGLTLLVALWNGLWS